MKFSKDGHIFFYMLKTHRLPVDSQQRADQLALYFEYDTTEQFWVCAHHSLVPSVHGLSTAFHHRDLCRFVQAT
jgi:hypothetical protein